MDQSAGLIVLVSRQLVPALQSLWYARRTRNLVRVVLVHSNNANESKDPARRLARLCRKYLKGVEIVRKGTSSDAPTPQTVAALLEREMAAVPQIERWTINATGGFKLMTLGIANTLLARTRTLETIYVERESYWFAVDVDGSGIRARRIKPPIEADITDAVPVTALVAAQFGGPFTHVERSQRGTKRTDGEILIEAVRRLEEGASWSGTELETFLAACLRAMGVSNLAQNLITRFGDRDIDENDLVVFHGKRVTVFDLKLPPESSKRTRPEPTFTERLQQAENVSRNLGGLDARWVMVYPGRTVTPDERLLASKGFRVTVLDASDIPRLLDGIARVLNLPVPPDLESLADALATVPHPFCAPPTPLPWSPPTLDGVVSAGLAEGQSWRLAALDGLGHFSAEKSSGDAAGWRGFLESHGARDLTALHSKKQWRWVWKLHGDGLRVLAEALRPHVGPVTWRGGELVRATPPAAPEVPSSHSDGGS